MEAFTVHRGRGVPFRRSNVDTDQIIPAEFLKRVTRTGFEDGLFATWRQDPNFELNDDRWNGASVLVAGPDFGTGSSREHAVWALQDYGFRVIFSSRFADIFRGNSLKGGLLTVVLDQHVIESIWSELESDPTTEIVIDLEAKTVKTSMIAVSFEIADNLRWRLLNGLDDIALTLANAESIGEFESTRESWRPQTLPSAV